MGRLALLTVAVLLVGASATAGQDAPAPREANLAAAEAASLRGAWAEAEMLYRGAVRADPSQGAAHRGLGFVLAELGRLDAALAAYEEAVRLNPNDNIAHYNRAAVLDRLDPRRALPAWIRYVAVAGTDPVEAAYVARARGRIRQLTLP